eukprot:UN13854
MMYDIGIMDLLQRESMKIVKDLKMKDNVISIDFSESCVKSPMTRLTNGFLCDLTHPQNRDSPKAVAVYLVRRDSNKYNTRSTLYVELSEDLSVEENEELKYLITERCKP